MAESEAKYKISKMINLFGVGLLLVVYIFAAIYIFSQKKKSNDPNNIIIRVTHWQLEAGIREGIDEMARKFEKRYFQDTGKKVTIVQNPISEKVYQQYVQTQCIGRTAPDLIEIGKYDDAYTTRFFRSMTSDIKKPNPYNEGTLLEGIPWADTFFDGMRSAMNPNNLEYYGTGLSTFTIRIFYNKDILKEALGIDNPPSDFQGFLDCCAALKEWAEKEKKDDFIPIAGSKYQLDLFRWRYLSSVILDFILRNDQTYKGYMGGSWEPIIVYTKGLFDYDDPAIRAGHEMLADLTEYFAPGFMAQDRMEAGFSFTQGRAAFITSGSWDAMSYFVQSNFGVGVMNFPMPDSDDHRYGKFVHGPVSEADAGAGFRLGVTKFSKHQDVALRFLQFLTTAENNEAFNKKCKWIPVVSGAEPHLLMKPFEPNTEGFWGADPFEIGSRTRMVYEQALWKFVEHKMTFEEFIDQLEKEMPRATAVDIERAVDNYHERLKLLNVPLSTHVATAVFSDSWGLDDAEAAIQHDKSIKKLINVMEGHSFYLDNGYWMSEWRRLKKEDNPRIKEIDKFVRKDI